MSKASQLLSTKYTTPCSHSASITSPSHHHLQYFYPDFYKAWRGQYYLINSGTIGFTSARNNFSPFLTFLVEEVCWDFCQDLVESFHICALQLKCQSWRLFRVLRVNLKKSHTFLRVIFWLNYAKTISSFSMSWYFMYCYNYYQDPASF